jgi:iron complex transport system permease protein
MGILLSMSVLGIEISAFLGGIATVLLVYLISSSLRGHDRTLVLVLSGVVIGALAGACISLVKVLADPYDQLPAITFWLLGSLAGVKLADLTVTAPLVLIGTVPLILERWSIGVLSLGDDEARSLGVDVGRLRAVVIAAATLMTASVVAISGVIGWIGLMMPHIARMLVGPNFNRLMPASMLLGAAFLLVVDTLARSLSRVETPVGILTAVLGAPFFLWLLSRGRRAWG